MSGRQKNQQELSAIPSRDVRPGDVFHDEGKVGQRAEKNSERFVGKLYNRNKPPSKSRTSFDQTTYEASSLRTPI
jgi:hypothetical protein